MTLHGWSTTNQSLSRCFLLLVGCVGTFIDRDASASAMQYSTDGWVDRGPGINPPVADTNLDPPLQFQGVVTGSFDGASPFSLGQFVIGKGTSSDVTFKDVLFYISFNIPSLSKSETNPNPPGTPYSYPEGTQYNATFTVAGHLSGGISSGQPHLVATVDRIDPIGLSPMIPEVV